MELSLTILISLLTSTVCQSPWNDDPEYFNPLELEDDLPTVISRDTTLTAGIGEQIKLPCEVNNLGAHSITWKRDSKVILFVIKGNGGIDGDGSLKEELKVVKDPRFKLHETHLIIDDLKAQDAHTYSCEVENQHYPLRAVHHVVNVEVPPKVWAANNDTFIGVDQGAKVILDCQTKGFPMPRITWARKDHLRLKGTLNGSAFVIYNVDRHDTGDYICFADNGVKPGTSASIRLVVKHSPDVITDTSVIYTGIGETVKISCNVYSNPPAKVEWFRQFSPVNPMRLKQSIDKKKNRHNLIFPKILEEDLSFYTCNASNFFGNNSKRIQITGRPFEVLITSDSIADSYDSYSLEFNVQSYSPILYYTVSYKNLTDSYDRWVNVTVPGGASTSAIVKSQVYNLTHLIPDSTYSVLINAQNEFGLSIVEEMFNFTTLSLVYDTIQPELIETSADPEVEQAPTVEEEPEPVDKVEELPPQLIEVEVPPASKKPYTSKTKPIVGNTLGSTSSDGPILTPTEKRAQTVAMITAISLSAFFL